MYDKGLYKNAPLCICWCVKNLNTERGAGEGAILIEVPAELKGLAPRLREFVSQLQRRMQKLPGRHRVDYGAVESEISELCSDLELDAHRMCLAQLDVDAPRVIIRGEEHWRAGRALGSYHTRVGAVQLERWVYRKAGERNGPIVDPIALRAGVHGRRWLPGAAQDIAFLMQQGTARAAKATAGELGILPYSTASFDRCAQLVGAAWEREQADIEDELIEELQIPEEAYSISVALDRVSVPIEKPRKRKPGRPRKGAPAKPIERVFCMAFCGCVTLHDREGRALHTLRYGAMPRIGSQMLVTGMVEDVARLLQRRPDLAVGLLADGAHEIWNLLESHMEERGLTVNFKLVDFYHLIEKLAPAAEVIAGKEDAAKLLKAWRHALKTRSSASKRILEELEQSGLANKRVGEERPVHNAITYLRNHAQRINHAAARRRGYPIGSGNVEATCKCLFSLRLKRPGSRWKQPSGHRIVQLRALALSDRWQPAMSRLSSRRRTTVTPVAA